jgi:predicted secreted protein
VTAQIRADLSAGARVILLGIDGSPTMGVELTAASDEWGGRPDKPRDEDYPVTPGAGVFTETLLASLDDRVRVRAVGIGQDLFDYDEAAELAKVGAELSR